MHTRNRGSTLIHDLIPQSSLLNKKQLYIYVSKIPQGFKALDRGLILNQGIGNKKSSPIFVGFHGVANFSR